MKSKTFRRLTAVVLAVMLTLSMCITGISAMAAETTKTITVGIINYICDDKSVDLSKAQVHYWDSSSNGDAACKPLNKTAKKSVGADYWSGAEQTFNMYTAEVPASATGFKFHIADRWFGADGDAAKNNAVYAFNYSGDKALYDTIAADEPDPTTATTATKATEATEKATTPLTGDVIKFTDNHGWGENGGKIYAYFFSKEEEGIAGEWPGKEMGNPEDNGMGQKNYSVAIPEGATMVIFNNDKDQTEDITLGDFEGYYTTDERDKNGHLVATGWNSTPAATDATEGSTKATTATKATEATEKATTPVTGDVVKFTDNHGWGENGGKIFAYFFSKDEVDIAGKWPGVAMGNPEDNGMGQKNYSVAIPEGATMVIFNNDADQTEDITLGDYEGYYTTDERDKDGHLVATGWNSTPAATDATEGSTKATTATKATEATEKATTPLTGDVIKFTDNHGWGENGGKIFAYFFSKEEEGIAGEWPGVAMGNPEDNGMGQKNYSVAIPEGATMVIFNNEKDQTEDITLGDYEGYYTTDERDKDGHLVAKGWNSTPAATDATEATGATTATGATSVTTPAAVEYYLVGNINGKDYGFEGDYQNKGDYKFVNGKVTVQFTEKSYVIVKTGDNANWYMTDGWLGENVKEATLYESKTLGEKCNKLCVPAGKVTFTLTPGKEKNTFVLSYVVDEASTSATDATTVTTPLTGDIVKFTDNHGWGENGGKIFAYFFSKDETDLAGKWPGTAMVNPEDNGMGQKNYSVAIPEGATNVIFNNEKDQTEDITLGDYEGYYTTEERDKDGHLIAYGWNSTPASTDATEATGATTVTTPLTGDIVKFTDNHGWGENGGKIFAYFFSKDEVDIAGKWPGVAMVNPEDNGMGQKNYSVAIPEGATNVIFNNDKDQTEDITLGDYEGYYTTEERDKDGHLIAYGWNSTPASTDATEATGATTVTKPVTGDIVKFTDNHGWGENGGKIFAYFFSKDEVDIAGKWPGVAMGNPEDNGMGQKNYSVAIPDGATMVIFNNDKDQTEDITLGGYEGYYTTDERDKDGHLVATGWNSTPATTDATEGSTTATTATTATEETTTKPVVADKATIYFAAPKGTGKDVYTWKNVKLYYGESTTMTNNKFIDMTATGKVETVKSVGKLTKVVPGDWEVFSATLTKEQIAAIDKASRVGFVNAANYNVRTDYRIAYNVAGDASIATYDGKMFVIDGCAGASEVNSYTGKWTESTGHEVAKDATIYFAAPKGTGKDVYTWKNVKLYYGESTTMANNKFVDMKATGKVATVASVGKLTKVVPGDWEVFSATLTAEQVAAIDKASRVGFVNAANYNVRTDYRIAYNVAGDASIAAYDGKMFVIDGCAGASEVNSYTGKWTENTSHDPVVSKTATIYFAAPKGTGKDIYTWKNVKLYYGESTTMANNKFIDMKATGKVATVASVGKLTKVVPGDWEVFSVTLTEEQIAAIDKASRVGFVNAANYNVRTDYRIAYNVAGDASIAACDGKMFVIDGCAGASEVNSYTGKWTENTSHDPVDSKTATIYFAAPKGTGKDIYTWKNVKLYYGESTTMTKNNFIDMKSTGKVETVKSVGKLTKVVPGDWEVFSVTLTEEQIAAIDKASRVGFANADNYNVRTDYRIAYNVTGDASIAAYNGKTFVIDGCASTTEVNSYTGKWK